MIAYPCQNAIKVTFHSGILGLNKGFSLMVFNDSIQVRKSISNLGSAETNLSLSAISSDIIIGITCFKYLVPSL